MFIVHAQGKRFLQQSIFQKHTREMSSTLISSDIKLCANVSSLLSLLSKGLDAQCNRSPLQKDIRAGSKTYLLLSIPRYLRLETLVREHQQGYFWPRWSCWKYLGMLPPHLCRVWKGDTSNIQMRPSGM